MSLIFITSPAKSLNESENWKTHAVLTSQPAHLKTASKIAQFLSQQKEAELQKVLSVSENLAKLNYRRMQNWSVKHTTENSKPALLLYNGAVYKQMQPQNYSEEQQTYAQNHIRIISGFYGLLRPYDLIQPYRLEMRTPLDITKEKSLSQFWSDTVTNELNAAVSKSKASAVINLASKEYSSTININELNVPFVCVDFKEKKEQQLKTVAIYAKKARGAMMEFAVKNSIRTIDSLKNFRQLGYAFTDQKKDSMLFVRSKK